MLPMNINTTWKCKVWSSPLIVITFIVYLTLVNCSSDYHHANPSEHGIIDEINPEVKSETVDIHYLYNISFNSL